MTERNPPRQLWLRQLRLAQASRQWRQLAWQRSQLQQRQARLDARCMALRREQARYLHRADAMEVHYAFALRCAAAIGIELEALERRIQATSCELAQLTAALAAARRKLDKAQRLLDDERAPGTRQRTGTP